MRIVLFGLIVVLVALAGCSAPEPPEASGEVSIVDSFDQSVESIDLSPGDTKGIKVSIAWNESGPKEVNDLKLWDRDTNVLIDEDSSPISLTSSECPEVSTQKDCELWDLTLDEGVTETTIFYRANAVIPDLDWVEFKEFTVIVNSEE